MPHTRSAKKSLRKNAKRRLHNRAAKKAIKTQVKKVMEAADGEDINQLRQEFLVATKFAIQGLYCQARRTSQHGRTQEIPTCQTATPKRNRRQACSCCLAPIRIKGQDSLFG